MGADRWARVAGTLCCAVIGALSGCGDRDPVGAVAPEVGAEQVVGAEEHSDTGTSWDALTSWMVRRFAVVEILREDGSRSALTGFVLNADEVVVPVDDLMEASEVSVRPACCEARPAEGVVAYNIPEGYAILHFTPPIDGYSDFPPSGVTLSAGDGVRALHRIKANFAGGFAVATSEANSLGISELAGLEGVSVFETRNNRLLDGGTLVVDEGGQPIAIFTRWMGLDRWVGARFAMVQAATRSEPIAWDQFRAELLGRSADTLALLAGSRRSEGRYAEAEAAARAAIEDDPDCWLAHYQLGVALDLAAGDAAESERSLRRAVELEPAWFEAQYSLGIILIRQGREREAVAPLRAAVEIAPNYANALGMLGVALWETEGASAGRAWMERACDASPDDYTHLNNLRLASEELGDSTSFLDRYRGFAERNPEHDTAGMMLGIMLYRQGQFAEAVPLVSAFAETNGDPRAHSLLVECLVRARRFDEAERALDRLAGLDPEHASIPDLRAMLRDAVNHAGP